MSGRASECVREGACKASEHARERVHRMVSVGMVKNNNLYFIKNDDDAERQLYWIMI